MPGIKQHDRLPPQQLQSDSVRSELGSKIDPLAASIADNHSRLTSLEEATDMYSDRVVDLEKQINTLKKTVSALSVKTEDLEGRQCRCNIRILGVREKFETGTRPATSVAKLLQDFLNLDAAPTLDRAHHSTQPTPTDGQNEMNE